MLKIEVGKRERGDGERGDGNYDLGVVSNNQINQGPCPENQERVIDGGLLAAYTTILRADFSFRFVDSDGSSASSRASTCSGSSAWRNSGIGELSRVSVKRIRSKAVKTVLSTLEGRSDSRVLEEICKKLDLKDLKARLSDIHVEYKRLKGTKSNYDPSWEDEHNEEGFDLLSLMLVAFKSLLEPHILSEKDFLASCKRGRLTEREEESFRSKIEMEKRYQEAHTFFTARITSVECVLKSGLQRLWFPIPSECFNMLKQTKLSLMQEVCLGTHEEKIKDFLRRADEIVWEMQHIETLAKNKMFRFVKDNNWTIKKFNFAVAILINLSLVMSFRAESPSSGMAQVDDETQHWIFVLGLLSMVLSFIVVSFRVVSRAPLIKVFCFVLHLVFVSFTEVIIYAYHS